jgi:hypothetical protein
LPYFVKAFDLSGSIRLRRDTAEGAYKKAAELIEARYRDVQIETPEGYLYFSEDFEDFREALSLRMAS